MAKTRRFYLRAGGSTSYDRTGITYPNKRPCDLEALVKDAGGTDLRWEPEFGRANAREVLSFSLPDLGWRSARKLGDDLYFKMGWGVNPVVHWRSHAALKGQKG